MVNSFCRERKGEIGADRSDMCCPLGYKHLVVAHMMEQHSTEEQTREKQPAA